MERVLKVTFTKAGNGGRTTRLTLPVKWIDALNITADDREVLVSFIEADGKIIIEKKNKKKK